MSVKKELHIATECNQRVALKLHRAGTITGVAEINRSRTFQGEDGRRSGVGTVCGDRKCIESNKYV